MSESMMPMMMMGVMMCGLSVFGGMSIGSLGYVYLNKDTLFPGSDDTSNANVATTITYSGPLESFIHKPLNIVSLARSGCRDALSVQACGGTDFVDLWNGRGLNQTFVIEHVSGTAADAMFTIASVNRAACGKKYLTVRPCGGWDKIDLSDTLDKDYQYWKFDKTSSESVNTFYIHAVARNGCKKYLSTQACTGWSELDLWTNPGGRQAFTLAPVQLLG